MATTFLEPGGDADFGTSRFWSTGGGTPDVATDFVHGDHIKSIKYRPGNIDNVVSPESVLSDTGTRISFYTYLNALPSATSTICGLRDSGVTLNVLRIRLTSAGVLQLLGSAQVGSDGATLSTGQWYRISLAYTITSTSVNRFELFVDGVSSISATDGSLANTGSSVLQIGNMSTNASLDLRSSDHYVDNSATLTDPGDIWVTAKRPNANGTLNEFTTQIGSGGSGYGSGHSPQVNERPLDTANGWSIQNAALKTEEYTIESVSEGDIDITGATIVDYVGWVNAKVGSASTGNIILNGSATNISLTTSYGMFTKIAGSTTYPSGADAIGMDTNTVNQLFSLAECGVMVAYNPPAFTGFNIALI